MALKGGADKFHSEFQGTVALIHGANAAFGALNACQLLPAGEPGKSVVQSSNGLWRKGT